MARGTRKRKRKRKVKQETNLIKIIYLYKISPGISMRSKISKGEGV